MGIEIGRRPVKPSAAAMVCEREKKERERDRFSAVRVSWAFGPVMCACGASDETL
jgi:hypothetical protein